MKSSGENGATGAGRLLAGRYRVIDQLGRGGMGVVWRALDEVLGREVAVKELRAYPDAPAAELAALRLRMEREARAAARVRHPGVVAVHDIAEHEGRPVIVMELVNGPSLDDVLRERGTLPPSRAADIGASVLDALAAAHRVGVLHRDVKPGNVLLEHGGRVVLTDFGIATLEESGEGSVTRLTGSGELVGSLDYLAPERARGEEPGPASDVWSLGATLYAALEGASPFRRTSTWSTLTAIVVEPLPEPRNAGPLGPALAELMDKDPARRADAGYAAAVLRAAAAGEPRPAAPGTLRLRPDEAEDSGDAAGADEAEGSAAAGVPHAPTVRSEPGPAPEGFGPPPAPVAPEPVPDPVAVVSGGQGTPPARGAALRRRRRAAVAASVAAVLLAGAGAAYLAVSGGGDGGTAASPEGSQAPAAEERVADDDAEGTGDRTEHSDPAPDKSAPESEEPAGVPDGSSDEGAGADRGEEKDQEREGGSEGASGSQGGSGGADGGSGGDTGGSDTGGGSDEADPAPAPTCHAIGDGKYNCEVWQTADSYNDAHQVVGTLRKGTNYFFCQQRTARRVTSGRWTNVWWAKTDDDSGNRAVWVSVVYVKGGDNDAPVPGLPRC